MNILVFNIKSSSNNYMNEMNTITQNSISEIFRFYYIEEYLFSTLRRIQHKTIIKSIIIGEEMFQFNFFFLKTPWSYWR